MEKIVYDMLDTFIAEAEEYKKKHLHGSFYKYICGEDFYDWIKNCSSFLKTYFPNEKVTEGISSWSGADSIWESTFNYYTELLYELRNRIKRLP